MAKLLMLKGLPGSGKSTWARAQLGWVRVNKDDLRTAMGGDWSPALEQKVIQERDRIIKGLLRDGANVISDDTNFAPKHETTLRNIARQCGSEFEVKEFDADLPTCIERDALRVGKAKVGEKVIRDMYNKYLKTKIETPMTPIFNDPSLPHAIICDLDGTLALHNGRGPFEYHKCDTDKVNTPIQTLLWAMVFDAEEQGGTLNVIYMSGRDDSSKDMTQEWLRRNDCPDGHGLYMRKAGDYRKDSIVKRELFDEHVLGKFYVEFCLDDRDQVVKLWRDMGLTCLQVAYGAF